MKSGIEMLFNNKEKFASEMVNIDKEQKIKCIKIH